MKKTIYKIFTLVLFSFLIVHCTLIIDNCEAQWVLVDNGMGNIPVYSLASSGNNLFAGTSLGVWVSNNYGLVWAQTTLNNQDVRSLAINGNIIYAGSFSGNGVYKSTDNGTSWNQTSLNNKVIRALAVSGNFVYAGIWTGNGLYKSTDNGTTWTPTALNNQIVRSLAVNGNNVYVGSGNSPSSGVFLSTDNGTNWAQTPLNNQYIGALMVNGNNVYAGTSQPSLYLSTNNCTSWTQTSLNSGSTGYVYSLAKNGNNIVAGTFNSGVYASVDNGTNWTQRNEGLPVTNTLVYDLCILNNYVFAAEGYSGNNGVYRRPLSDIITGIQPISNEVPNKFSLSQNYPNPFNPVTKINFNIAKTGFIKLNVFDALGREIETLINQQMNAGSYSVDFDGSKIVSGVYFYRLQSADFTDVKKLVLLK